MAAEDLTIHQQNIDKYDSKLSDAHEQQLKIHEEGAFQGREIEQARGPPLAPAAKALGEVAEHINNAPEDLGAHEAAVIDSNSSASPPQHVAQKVDNLVVAHQEPQEQPKAPVAPPPSAPAQALSPTPWNSLSQSLQEQVNRDNHANIQKFTSGLLQDASPSLHSQQSACESLKKCVSQMKGSPTCQEDAGQVLQAVSHLINHHMAENSDKSYSQEGRQQVLNNCSDILSRLNKIPELSDSSQIKEVEAQISHAKIQEEAAHSHGALQGFDYEFSQAKEVLVSSNSSTEERQQACDKLVKLSQTLVGTPAQKQEGRSNS